MKTLILAAIRCFLMFSLPAVAIAPSAYATRYEVNRSRSDGSGGTASLIGTVDVPLGSYTIMHLGPTPFTSVSLTLIVNGGAPFHLDQVASGVFGTRQFFIFATASSLIFDTANANANNAAALQFSDTPIINLYDIGSDGPSTFSSVFHQGRPCS